MAEISLGHIQNGYPGLAKFIGQDLDQGLGIFKQFSQLNARNLLYMQAELLCLEQELDVITYVDEHGTDPTTKNFARSVWEMKKPPNRPQWEKVLEIRGKLKDYSMSSLRSTSADSVLTLQPMIACFNKPASRN